MIPRFTLASLFVLMGFASIGFFVWKTVGWIAGVWWFIGIFVGLLMGWKNCMV